MAVEAEDLESELIENVCERIRDQLPDEHASLAEAFVRQYCRWVPAEDLAGREISGLYGAAIAHWRVAYERAPGEAKVHVYNPDPAPDGWSSPHTVIEIVSDDMPFIVDSVTMELAREGFTIDLVIHPVIGVQRDRDGRAVAVLHPDALTSEAVPESVLHAELVREPDAERLDRPRGSIGRVLEEVRATVDDGSRCAIERSSLSRSSSAIRPPWDGRRSTRCAPSWSGWRRQLPFLGYREYELVGDDQGAQLKAVDDTGLGVLRGRKSESPRHLGRKAAVLARAPHLVVLTKANSRSTVHRPAYLDYIDYIGVKQFDTDGNVMRERRFLGLYTSSAYRASPREIPLLRGKVQTVMERAGFLPAGHDAKALLEILESYPARRLVPDPTRTTCSRSRSGSSAWASASGCACSSGKTHSIVSSPAWSPFRATVSIPRTDFRLASRLQLAWLRDRIYELPRANRWQALARAALHEDLLGVHRELTREVLESASDGERADAAIEGWESHNRPKLERCLSTLADMRASRTYDTTTLSVALREVRAFVGGGNEGEPTGGGAS